MISLFSSRGCVGDADPVICSALKPGAYLEVQDLDPELYCDDGSYTENHAAMKWGKLFKEALPKMERPLPDVTEYKRLMEDAGFVEVQEHFYKRASNDWPKDPKMKEIGRVSRSNSSRV